LGPVQQSQAFLGFKSERLDACRFEGLAPLHSPTVLCRLAFSDSHQREVSQRREITRGPN
jgi:hypothetical protein